MEASVMLIRNHLSGVEGGGGEVGQKINGWLINGRPGTLKRTLIRNTHPSWPENIISNRRA